MKSLKEFVNSINETKVSAEFEDELIKYLVDTVKESKDKNWVSDHISTILINVGSELKENKNFDAFNKGVENYLNNAKNKFADFDEDKD